MTTKATREGEGEGGEELDIKVRPKYAATQRAMRRRRRKEVVEIPRHVGQKNARPSGSVRHAENCIYWIHKEACCVKCFELICRQESYEF